MEILQGLFVVLDNAEQDLDDVKVYLTSLGVPKYVAGNMLRNAYVEEVHWSDTYGGIVHDCAAHDSKDSDPSACYPDASTKLLAIGIPEAWLRKLVE